MPAERKVMIDRTSRIMSGGRVVRMLRTAIVFAISGSVLLAQPHSSPQSPVGAWAVQVTLRDCVTHARLGPAFTSLVTRHQGGTVSDYSAAAAFAIGQRTSGHGTWTH